MPGDPRVLPPRRRQVRGILPRQWPLSGQALCFVIISAVVDLDAIKTKFQRRELEFTQHAVDQTLLRHITVEELCEAIEVSEVIEEYPADKYGPSSLLLGFTAATRPLHVQVSDPSRPVIKVITVYQPDPERWVGLRYRRNPNE